ncbi:MAG: hypothetical protein AAB223_07365, partial [Pseudomonadota bacterium]
MSDPSANAVFLHLPRRPDRGASFNARGDSPAHASAGEAAETADSWGRLKRALARHGAAEAFYIHALAKAHFDAGCA